MNEWMNSLQKKNILCIIADFFKTEAVASLFDTRQFIVLTMVFTSFQITLQYTT